MKVHEETIIRHSFQFTEEDLELITSVVEDVWKFASVKTLVRNHASGFCKVLHALDRVMESAVYHADLTSDYDKDLEILADTFCSFEVKFENDPRFNKVDEMWREIIRVRKLGSNYERRIQL